MKEEIIQFQKVLFLVCLIAPLVLYFVASEMREYKKMQERKMMGSILKRVLSAQNSRMRFTKQEEHPLLQEIPVVPLINKLGTNESFVK